jgi:hypothetical protein
MNPLLALLQGQGGMPPEMGGMGGLPPELMAQMPPEMMGQMMPQQQQLPPAVLIQALMEALGGGAM